METQALAVACRGFKERGVIFRGGTCVDQAQMMSADVVEGVGRYRWGNDKGEGDCCGNATGVLVGDGACIGRQ